MISSGNRTEWGAIRSCLITNMITDRVEGHKFLLPINVNVNVNILLSTPHRAFQG